MYQWHVPSWKNVATPPFEAIKSIWIAFMCFQWVEIEKSNVPLTALQRNPTLHWLDFGFNAKWDRHIPRLQRRRSFAQICLHIVASSNLPLHIFSQFWLIALMMPRSITYLTDTAWIIIFQHCITVWGRGWTTCLLHDSPLFGSHFEMRLGM